MATIADKLWNWGHLAGSHNEMLGLDCSMSPEQFAEEYGIPNAFIVSYGGNIQPPYGKLAESFSSLREIKWSVLGDAGTPLPAAELGNTEDVIAAAETASNITGGVVDDFFSPQRLERFTPEVLMKIKKVLNDKGLDFWCVLYSHDLIPKDPSAKVDLAPYIPCFDGVTFWIWQCREIADMELYLDELKQLIGDKPLMLGVYLWDYQNGIPMDGDLFKAQLTHYFDLAEQGDIEGIIVCSNTIGDADLEANRILKDFIRENGQREVLI